MFSFVPMQAEEVVAVLEEGAPVANAMDVSRVVCVCVYICVCIFVCVCGDILRDWLV
jgi:hypothetical protein